MIDYNIYDLGFNRFLNRELTPLILQTTNNLNSPTILGSGMGGLSEISPSEIASGELDGNITMVLGKLQSANFVSGSTGWIINYDGTVEFNSGVFRGSLTVGTNAWHVDTSGNMWWGNYASYATCLAANGTYISSAGVARFNSITVSGYILVGGAAGDVNSGVTTISGTKLTTGTVTADYVVASISISSPTITGGSIAIGTGNNIFKADANGIYLGNATFGSAPFRVTMAGAVTASNVTITNGSIGSGSSYTGNSIADAHIGDLTCLKITSGDFTVGGASQPANIKIIESSAGGAGATTSKLYWQSSGGTLRAKIWGDSSGYIGYNAIGGYHYFYTNNNENVIIVDSAQTIFNNGISCRGSFNMTSTNNARFTNRVYYNSGTATDQYIAGDTDMLTYYAKSYHYFNINNTEMLKVSAQGTQTTNGLLYLSQVAGATGGGYTSQNGAIYYDSTNHKFMGRKNGSWVEITTT